MSSDLVRRRLFAPLLALLIAGGAALSSCTERTTEPELLPRVDSVRVVVQGPTSVALSWNLVPLAIGEITNYVVERRADLQGAFEPIADIDAGFASGGRIGFVDTELEPSTIYGYRVYAVSNLGDRSRMSNVAGVLTPPLPGLEVFVLRQGPAVLSAVNVVLRRGDSVVTTLAARPGVYERVSPLPLGDYDLSVTGLPTNCSVSGAIPNGKVRDDLGAKTLDSLRVVIGCRDPAFASVQVVARVSGTSRDTVVALRVTGQADDASLPDSVRVVNRRIALANTGQTLESDVTLRPGAYTFVLEDLAANCSVQGGPAGVSRQLPGGSLETIAFDIACRSARPPAPPVSERPYRLEYAFDRAEAAPGDTVVMRIAWDRATAAEKSFNGMQFELRYEGAILDYLTVRPGAQFPIFVVNSQQKDAGLLAVGLGSLTPQIVADSSFLGELVFRVRPGLVPSDSAGTNVVVTETAIVEVVTDGLTLAQLDTSRVWADEAVLDIVAGSGGTGGGGTTPPPTGGGGGTNPPPPASVIAEANGPYTGTAGTAIAFSSAGSTTGSDVAYRWFFPGGLESSQQNPTFTFSTAGTYTVRLEVTRSGVVARDSAVVTVNAPTNPPPGGGGGTTPPPPTTGGPRLFYSFANNTSGTVTMTIFLDLTADVPATNGPEVLGGWSLNEIRFDPAVLEWVQGSIRLGQYHSGVTTISQDRASQGILTLLNVSTEAGRPNRTGLITLARIDFRPVGSRGASMTTGTVVGSIIGAGEVGFYNYTPLVTVQNGTYVIP